MSFSFQVYWSFRSPYSHLVTKRLIAVQRTYDLNVDVKVVYPTAIRAPEFFDSVNKYWLSYLALDSKRVADMQGTPFRWPNPDPIVQDMATKAISKDQPYIYRLTRLGIAATREGKGLEFVDQIGSLIFGGTENWHQGDHLAKATERAGLDLAKLDEVIVTDEESIEAEIKANQLALTQAGHWGVPLMVYEGEPFFGQDRLDAVIWRMEQAGLQKR